MLTRKIELLVGMFILTGIAAFLVLVFNVAN
ncbi:MAG: outer membrane lipid asymmetry maintenance protein MlaD, partial [Shewanella sp.]